MNSDQLQKAANLYNSYLALVSQTTGELNSDVGFAANQWRKNPQSQFWRRTLVRCICALVEGVLGLLKHFTQPSADYFGVSLDKKDIQVITESRKSFENGVTKKKPARLGFRDNVKGTFRVFTKAHDIRIPIKYGDRQFQCLCATFELRNRLMHPKHPSDLNVSDKAIDDADQGGKWFHRTFHALWQECERKLPWGS